MDYNTIVKYPHLVLALVEIVYDNGVINRCSDEEHMVINRVMDLIIERYNAAMLDRVEGVLASTTDQEFEDLTVGETPFPMLEHLKDANEVLNFAFEVM